MEDRAKRNNGKSCTLMCPSDFNPADFSAFLTALKAGTVYVDITPNNDLNTNPGVTVVGTALNKANILTDATAAKFGYQASANPTPNDVLNILGDSYGTSTTVTLSASGWVGSSAPFTQTVLNSNIKGIASIPRWTVDPSTASGATGKQAMIDQANYIGLVQTSAGQITFTCFAEKPTVNIVVCIGE